MKFKFFIHALPSLTNRIWQTSKATKREREGVRRNELCWVNKENWLNFQFELQERRVWERRRIAAFAPRLKSYFHKRKNGIRKRKTKGSCRRVLRMVKSFRWSLMFLLCSFDFSTTSTTTCSRLSAWSARAVNYETLTYSKFRSRILLWQIITWRK